MDSKHVTESLTLKGALVQLIVTLAAAFNFNATEHELASWITLGVGVFSAVATVWGRYRKGDLWVVRKPE